MVRRIFLIPLILFSLYNFLFASERLLQQTASREAKNFTLLNLDNKEISLSDYSGKAVLLFFWTTWCPYCIRELKKMEKFHAELKKDNLEVLAVNSGESEMAVRKFARFNFFPYEILLDLDADVAASYGILGVPTFVLINKKGNVVYNKHYFPEEYNKLTPE